VGLRACTRGAGTACVRIKLTHSVCQPVVSYVDLAVDSQQVEVLEQDLPELACAAGSQSWSIRARWSSTLLTPTCAAPERERSILLGVSPVRQLFKVNHQWLHRARYAVKTAPIVAIMRVTMSPNDQ
jgi:hypothetical protein